MGLVLYGMEDSGNCYKPCLLLAYLERPYTWVSVDILRGESRTPGFLARNPNGRVPLLEPEPGVFLPESNAILHYLAEGTPYLPEDRLERARVLAWMFFEQYSHEPYIATPRYWIHLLGRGEAYRDEIARRREPGLAALRLLDAHLAASPWLAAGRMTIADIALYAYTHVAEEGGYSLAPFPHLRAWLGRIASQPRHVPMRRLAAQRPGA
jgi:glutathione S-transferase